MANLSVECRLQIIAPYAHFDIPRIGQSYVLFRYTVQHQTLEESRISLLASLHQSQAQSIVWVSWLVLHLKFLPA